MEVINVRIENIRSKTDTERQALDKVVDKIVKGRPLSNPLDRSDCGRCMIRRRAIKSSPCALSAVNRIPPEHDFGLMISVIKTTLADLEYVDDGKRIKIAENKSVKLENHESSPNSQENDNDRKT